MRQTKAPVPATRIQNGMDSIKGLKIDPFRSAESQVRFTQKTARFMGLR
jgi:ribosome maturation protein Sdo1